MATQWISPTWRMPEESNQSKFDNYSLGFDDASGGEYITFNSPSSLWTAGGLSVSFWLKTTTTENDSIITMDDYSAGNRNWQIEHRSSGNVVRLYVFGSSNVFVNTSVSINDGNWHHLVFTYEPSTALKVYIDGSLDNSNTTSIPASRNTDSANLRIATNDFGSQYTGSLSHVSIFDYALSQSQVDYLYNSGTPQNPMAISGNAPIAYYPLGGGSTGDAGTSPSTLTVPNESVPSATVFDFSTSDVVESPHISIDSSFTVSAWVNTTDTGTYGNVFSPDDFGSNRNWQFFRWNNKIRFLLRDSSGSAIYDSLATATETINNGQWHHVAATWDGTTNSNGISIYVDGNLSIQGTSSSTALKNSVITQKIGAGNVTWDFIGKISNCQLWNTNLSSPEITTLYNNGVPYTGTQPQAANLKAWYKLNVDTSTWNGSDWIIGDNSVDYKTSLNFNGDSYIAISPNTFDATNGLTMSCWVRYDASAITGLNWLCSNGNTGGVNSQFNTRLEAGGAWFNYFVGSSTYTGINGLGDGQWHHIAQTVNYSTGDVMYYKDGVPSSTVSTWGSSYATAILATISTSFYPFGGNISNFAIFSSALSTSNIVTLYNNGYPEVTPSFSPTSWWKLNNLTTGIQDSGSASNNGTNNGASTSNIPVSPVNGTSVGMTTANLVNSDLTRSIPYSSYSMEFDGGDWATTGISLNTLSVTTSFSVSFWVNISANTAFDNIISAPTNNTVWDSGFGVYVNGTGITFWVEQYNGTNQFVETAALNNDQWYNVIATFDTTNGLKLYVDGSTLTTASGTTIDGLTNNIFIGAAAANSLRSFNGNINNIAIWNSELSQDKTLTIYNGGVPNDISSLSPVSWWSLAGDSYYDGTNFILPDISANSNNATTANMAGTELIGNGPGSTANGIATSMNIPENLQGNAPNSSKNAFSVNMNSADRVEDVPA